MPAIHEGLLDAKGLKFAIIASRFNHFINDRLLEGAMDCLLRHNAEDGNIAVFKVPGSFEIPLVAAKLAESGKYDAIVCLGVLIRGATPHFEFISAEVTKGIASTALQSGVPVSFGVLTADTLEQAIERAGTKSGNKGWAAAATAIEMADLYRKM